MFDRWVNRGTENYRCICKGVIRLHRREYECSIRGTPDLWRVFKNRRYGLLKMWSSSGRVGESAWHCAALSNVLIRLCALSTAALFVL